MGGILYTRINGLPGILCTEPFCHLPVPHGEAKKLPTVPFEQKDGAPPGIEPGPPAPKAGILPLNYGAVVFIIEAFI